MKTLEIGKYYKHTDDYELEGIVITYLYVCAADEDEYFCATSDINGAEWAQIPNERIDTYYIEKCVEISEEEYQQELLKKWKETMAHKAEITIKRKRDESVNLPTFNLWEEE